MNDTNGGNPTPPKTNDGDYDPFAGMDAISRRRFLSLLSASAALAVGASCSKIDRGSIVPYTRRPGEVIPGVASYYASTFQEGLTTYGVLVKTREGRPIHIEGNADHAISRGTVSLRAIGDLLGLYDPDRLRRPLHNGKPSTWEEAEKSLAQALTEARTSNKSVLLLTGAVVSPSQRALIDSLKLALPGLHHAAWEAIAPHSAMQAAKALYGKSILPKLHLDRADVILSLQSDFLGTDPNAPMRIKEFASRRAISKPSERMNRLWVFEGCMTLTGSNADQRMQIRPSKIAIAAFALFRLLHESHFIGLPAGLRTEDLRAFEVGAVARHLMVEPSLFRTLAADLAKARKSAVVLAGDALPPGAHLACHFLNSMLEANGNTIDSGSSPTAPELQTVSSLKGVFEEASRGKFAVGIFWDANPAYAFPDTSLWKSAAAKIPEKFRIGLYEDETALDCSWRLPEHHWLEAWGDFESSTDFICLRQPAMGAIHDSRQAEDFLISCMRRMKIAAPPNYLEFLKSRWQSEVYPAASPVPFGNYWNAALHNGGAKREIAQNAPAVASAEAVRSALADAALEMKSGPQSEFELILSPGTGVYDGRYANNGWLNELPDPVTKATWMNPLLLSVSDAAKLGLKNGDSASIVTGAKGVDVSVIVQPGQSPGVVSLALGYGRQTGNVAIGVGVNAYALMDVSSDSPYLFRGAKIASKGNGKIRPVPRTQDHNRMDGRDLARSWTLGDYFRKAGNEEAAKGSHHSASLVPDREYTDHKWGMAVDLSACVGCSACIVACQSENNIPIVGPEQVLKGREMHWMRIDRYYEGDPQNPVVRHQPIFCQHCDNAPCEIVCPVNATTHSPDGLNQMAYNRCVGTRYCSNNCPFKVRRFNFFDYTSMKKEPEILVHNPEVTVRPRGVMEKCTFCIQRIQNARQKAKVEKRKIMDGEIQPACAAACPANAIVFGDLKDPSSRVSILSNTSRRYRMLEELGIKPSVTYLADISNPAGEKGKA